MSVDVVRAQLPDAPAACEALRRSISGVCAPDYAQLEGFVEDWLKNKTPENVAQWIENPDAHFVVARPVDSSAVVGVGSVSRTGAVLLCYVVPEYLGQGVGRSILAALESQALDWGLARLTALSTVTARAFYVRQGFVPCGDAVVEGGVEIEFPMAKDCAARPR